MVLTKFSLGFNLQRSPYDCGMGGALPLRDSVFICGVYKRMRICTQGGGGHQGCNWLRGWYEGTLGRQCGAGVVEVEEALHGHSGRGTGLVLYIIILPYFPLFPSSSLPGFQIYWFKESLIITASWTILSILWQETMNHQTTMWSVLTFRHWACKRKVWKAVAGFFHQFWAKPAQLLSLITDPLILSPFHKLCWLTICQWLNNSAPPKPTLLTPQWFLICRSFILTKISLSLKPCSHRWNVPCIAHLSALSITSLLPHALILHLLSDILPLWLISTIQNTGILQLSLSDTWRVLACPLLSFVKPTPSILLAPLVEAQLRIKVLRRSALSNIIDSRTLYNVHTSYRALPSAPIESYCISSF